MGWGDGEDCSRKRKWPAQGRREKRRLGAEKHIWDWRSGGKVEKDLRHIWRSCGTELHLAAHAPANAGNQTRKEHPLGARPRPAQAQWGSLAEPAQSGAFRPSDPWQRLSRTPAAPAALTVPAARRPLLPPLPYFDAPRFHQSQWLLAVRASERSNWLSLKRPPGNGLRWAES